ncbi:hypothetical protein PVAP13_5KG401507 [Panicum virgatum]|uniref:Uncharacterized protein n=1 Tax=Panicum virgatum TaxID=38727 RepID=A0A8T0SP98_PANVG|nr:hypothetical protein PVAP13_5KG401507 [Panicum virgatum]
MPSMSPRGGGRRGLRRGSCCGERWRRLVEVLAELKRPQARARAAELQRRLEHTYSKHHRHVEVARGRVHEIGERLQEGEAAAAAAATAPYELDHDRSAATSACLPSSDKVC